MVQKSADFRTLLVSFRVYYYFYEKNHQKLIQLDFLQAPFVSFAVKSKLVYTKSVRVRVRVKCGCGAGENGSAGAVRVKM